METLNWNFIQRDPKYDNKLYIGSCPRTEYDIQTIHDQINPQVFMSLQAIECHRAMNIHHESIINAVKSYNTQYVWVPMLDFNPSVQRQVLPRAVKALDVSLSYGDVYLFCTAGINRSPLVELGHMVFIQGETIDDGLTLIQTARDGAYPYIDALIGCRNDITTANHERVQLQAYYNYVTGEGDHVRNWLAAESRIIRDVILGLPAVRTGLIYYP